MTRTTLSISSNGKDFKEIVSEKLTSMHDRSDYPTDGPEVEILAAQLKGEFCKYKYEFTTGVVKGDNAEQTGTNIVHPDMIRAFKKLHVHLAVACEEIDKHDIKDIDTIPEWDSDADVPKRLSPLQEVSRKVFHFSCSTYRTDGTGENAGVILVGQKRLSTGEYVKLESPKITWSGDYYFVNELKVVVDDIAEEVTLYRNGKWAVKQGDLFESGENEIGDGKIED